MKNTQFKKKVALVAVVLLSGVMLLSSCLKNKNDFNPSTSNFSIVNGYFGTQTIDYWIDGQQANAQPLLYKQNSAYQEVFAGQRILTITKGGTTDVIISGQVGFSPDRFYSIFIAKSTVGADSILGVITLDSLNAPASGNAKIRFANLNSDNVKIDVSVQGSTDTLFSNRSFLDVSLFKQVAAGSKVLEIRQSGNPEIKGTINVNLESGKIYTLSTFGASGSASGIDAFGVQLNQNQ